MNNQIQGQIIYINAAALKMQAAWLRQRMNQNVKNVLQIIVKVAAIFTVFKLAAAAPFV